MTVEEISKFAIDGIKTADMNCPERCLFYVLKELYRDFKDGKITKYEGEQRKADAVRQFEKDCEYYEKISDVSKRFAEFWKEIEETGSEYGKNPTIENADNFFKAVYGAGRKKKLG